MRKVVIFCILLIALIGVVSAVTVTGECGVCPQECIDHLGSCTFTHDETCSSAAQTIYDECMNNPPAIPNYEAACSALRTQYYQRSSCTYDETTACYDTDGGVKEFWYGETTTDDETEVDFCKTLGFIPGSDGGYYWLYDQYETGYCKRGTSLWGGAGYVDGCYVREYSCSSSTTVMDSIRCNSGICYNGKCACESTVDCGGSGYRCEPDPDGKGNFCKKISCNDTDVSTSYPDGKDPYTFGIVVSELNSPAPGTGDLCKDSDTVQEFFCLFGQNWAQDFDCPQDYACLNGECVPVNCGNGFLEGYEECDDGNLVDNDGCSSSCIVEYCRDYTTKTSCFAFTFENCTWTPPETGTAGEGGGCCPPEQEWRDGVCGGTDNLCNIPFTSTIANFLQSGSVANAIDTINLYRTQAGLSEVDSLFNSVGPIDKSNKQYCAQIIKGIDYGFWYPTETY